MAMVAVIFATSCQRVEDPTGLGTTSEVTFSVQSPDQLTRAAIGDGSEAKNLIVAVYDKKGEYLGKVSPESPINGSDKHWDVTLSLVDGMAYDIVFWAQADDAPYTLDKEGKTLTVNYDNAKAQDEKRDAFYAVVKDYEADGANTVAVKLTRPFAQLNIVTTDYTTAVNSGVNVTTTGLKVSNLPTTMNLLSGDVSGNTEAVFSDANKPAESHPSFTNTDDVKYTWLSMNYVLASEEGDLISTVTLTGTTKEKVYREIPVKRNFRTNIYGKILTSDVDFDVDTDQGFDGDEDIEVWDGESTAAPTPVDVDNDGIIDYYTISTPDQLAGFAQSFIKTKSESVDYSNATIKLTDDIDLGTAYWTPIGQNSEDFTGVFDGQGYTIYNLKVNVKNGSSNAGFFGVLTGTVKNVIFDGVSINSIGNGAGTVAGSIFNTGIIEEVTVKNAKIEGNRRLGGIAGYVYGTIKNCNVENIELTATPDQLSGSFDNGDKVGGIVGLWAKDNGESHSFSGNTVKNATIKGFRDLGGIAGAAKGTGFTNNKVEGATIVADQVTGYYAGKDINIHPILGNILEGERDSSNSQSDVELSVIVGSDATLSSALTLKQVPTILLAENAIIEGSFRPNHGVSIKSLNPEKKATIKGRVNIDGYADGIFFKDIKFDINEDSKVKKSFTGASYNYPGIVVIYASEASFEGCEFKSDIATGVCGINYGAHASNKLLKVNNCTFNGDFYAIRSRTLFSITNSTFNIHTDQGTLAAVFTWGNGEAGTQNNGGANLVTFTGNKNNNGNKVYGVQLTSTTFNYCHLNINVQDNENFIALSQSVNPACNFKGCTFEEGSERFGVDLNGTWYASLSNAVAAAAGGETITINTPGTYEMPGVSRNNLKIVGDKDVVLNVTTPSMNGNNITIEGVTITTPGDKKGFQHSGEVTYNGVTINSELTCYGVKDIFNECTFNLEGVYVWTYGSRYAQFNKCTFNTTGKAILVYKDGGQIESQIDVKNCTFNASSGAKASAINNQNCAAIEIDNYEHSKLNVYTEGNNVNSNFSGLWRIKKYKTGNKVSVNGKEYNQIALDGKLMTIDQDNNVTFLAD